MSLFIPNSGAGTPILSTTISLPATQSFTLMCWVNLAAGGPTNIRTFLSANPNISIGTGLEGNVLNFLTGVFYPTQVLNTNTWYHVAMTIISSASNAHIVKGFLNGNILLNSADTTPFTPFDSFVVGNSIIATPTTGNIKDVRIWTNILSQREIINEINSKVPIKKPAYIFSSFDDDQYKDLSGNNHAWTISGAGILTQYGPIKAWQP